MTWLYIPSNCAPASACSEKAPALHSSFLATSTAPFATWSGKPLLPRNLSALWKRERSIRRLSGLTCLPSTAQRGADAWICSLRASPARTSALPGGARALMASARACSSTSSTLPMLAERGGLFWRTSAPSLLPPPPLWTKPKGLSTSARPPASWENWPTAGGTRSGSLFPRPTWVPAMGGHAGFASHGGLWTTPDVCSGARDMSKVDPQLQKRADTNRTTGLPTEAVMWPTPASRDYRTPNSESLEARGGGSKGEQLPNFVQHHFSPLVQPTPFGATSSVPVVSVHGSELSPTTKPEHVLGRLRLNPAFACWLMGWPSWWTNPGLTNCARPAMALYRCRLQWHLSSLCGAQQDIEKAAA